MLQEYPCEVGFGGGGVENPKPQHLKLVVRKNTCPLICWLRVLPHLSSECDYLYPNRLTFAPLADPAGGILRVHTTNSHPNPPIPFPSQVQVTLPGQPSTRVWRIARLSPSSAADTTFTLNSSSSSRRQQQQGESLPNGSTVSVAAYFKAVYGVELAAPQLPCVDVGRQGGQAIWYPLELCR